MVVATRGTMSRFVFATMPLPGHTRPALPIARALVERSHSVRWLAGAAFAGQIEAVGATRSVEPRACQTPTIPLSATPPRRT